jgi:hypothetical protein
MNRSVMRISFWAREEFIMDSTHRDGYTCHDSNVTWSTTNIVVYLRSFTSDALRDMTLARSRESSKEIDDEEQVHLPLVHYRVQYLGQGNVSLHSSAEIVLLRVHDTGIVAPQRTVDDCNPFHRLHWLALFTKRLHACHYTFSLSILDLQYVEVNLWLLTVVIFALASHPVVLDASG